MRRSALPSSFRALVSGQSRFAPSWKSRDCPQTIRVASPQRKPRVHFVNREGTMSYLRFAFTALFCTLILTEHLQYPHDPKPGVDWPSLRGIRASGAAEGFPTLTKWDVAGNEGVRWRAKVDGLGTSSPIVWGSRVCLTTAVSGKVDSNIK